MSDYIATELSKAVIKYNKVFIDYMGVNTSLNDCLDEFIQCIKSSKNLDLIDGFEKVYLDLKAISTSNDSVINIPSSELNTLLGEKGCDTSLFSSIHSLKESYLQWYGSEKLQDYDSLKLLSPTTNCKISVSEDLNHHGKSRFLSVIIDITENSNLRINIECNHTQSISAMLKSAHGSSSLNMHDRVFDVMGPLIEAVQAFSDDDFINLGKIQNQSLLNPIIFDSNLSSGAYQLPIEVQISMFDNIMSDFFAGGFASDKITDKNHLVKMLKLCESEDDYSIRSFIGSFTELDFHSSKVQRIFGNDDLIGVLDNLAIYIECNKASNRGLVSSTESAVIEMLAHYFVELSVNDRVVTYQKITEHPSFNKEVLDDHSFFMNFAISNKFALEEYRECLLLAAVIDKELQSETIIQNPDYSSEFTTSLSNSI
tara:strand:- start:91825 stop:93105 length:1281 start_codon:yes stop_codon:yes gene_type:complete